MGTENVRLGVCDITYDGVDLGLKKGGSELVYTPEYRTITVDEFGNTPINDWLLGENVSVIVQCAETARNRIKVACPMATEIVDGTKRALTFGSAPGKELLSRAKTLFLHPKAMGNSTELDVTVYKAVVASEFRLPWKLDGEAAYQLTFKGLVDPTRTNGDYLFRIGDADALVDLVAPTVANIVPALGASGVDKSITTTVQITFDKAMDPLTINSDNIQVFQADTLAPKAGEITYLSATNKAVFAPGAEWAGGKEFVVFVGTGVRSANHVAMTEPYISKFTTAA